MHTKTQIIGTTKLNKIENLNNTLRIFVFLDSMLCPS